MGCPVCWAKHRGVDAKNIHATIDPMVKQMLDQVNPTSNPLTVDMVKNVLATGYRDAELPSVARVVELFLDLVKAP